MTTEKGVWNIQQVRDKQLQSLWTYTTSGDNHTLWAWGSNTYGSMGVNQPHGVKYSSPVQIPGTTWKSIAGYQGTGNFLLATKTDNTLWSWGYSVYGSLGINVGDGVKRSSPTQIPGTSWKSAARGTHHGMATRTDGTLWTWGKNENGELGQNKQGWPSESGHGSSPASFVSSPVQVPGTDWDIVKNGGNRSSFVTRTDGTLWSWGQQTSGQLGLNDRTYRSSPVQVGTATDWSNSTIEASPGRTHYLKSDGTLYATGYGGQGGLGQNNRTYYSSPAQIPGTTWKSVGSSEQTTVATKTDGTAWVWGMNEYGELGQNQAEAQLGAISSPTQIPGTTWNTVSAPGKKNAIFVTKTDGTAWGWGRNYLGGLGVNVDGSTTGAFSSPTQLAATDGWVGSMSGSYSTVAFGLRSL